MEMELKNVIEKLKIEGVEAADKKAEEIIQEAEAKAKALTESAEKEKTALLKKAEEDAVQMKANAEEAIKQASRDVLLGLKQEIVDLFDGVIKKDVAAEMSSETLKEMLIKLVENFRQSSEAEIEILLSEDAKGNVEKLFLAGLKKEMLGGVTLKASSAIENGFRIGEKDSNAYYDFTDEAIAEAFKTFLNPKLAELLSK